MKAHGDYESVNLSTGEFCQRVVGDGESTLERVKLAGDKCANCGYSRHVHEVCWAHGGYDEWFELCSNFQEPQE